MKERPILFSGPMVRALLDGTKTQTRRLVKLPHANPLGQWEATEFGGPGGGRNKLGEEVQLQCAVWHTRTGEILCCPHGQPGDRLWVRESFYQSEPLEGTEVVAGEIVPSVRTVISYAADKYEVAPGRKRPSIHMPRWASRILLEIVSVRVERLHGMSDEDALAEGIREVGQHDSEPIYWFEPVTEAKCGMGSPLEAFANLWRGINGDSSWNSNPWVWAVEFKKVSV